MSRGLRPIRRFGQSFAVAALAAAVSGAFAAEHPSAAASGPERAASAPKTAASASKAGADESRAGGRPELIQSPLDRVRDRLARKLGATEPPSADGPEVVRIVSRVNARPDGDLVGTPTALHGTPARRSPKPMPKTPVPPMSGTPPGAAHWDYVGATGPDAWAQLKPEFSKCSDGVRQSPIDIRDGIPVDLDPVAFEYKAGSFRVVDNGHTVQVNVAPGNSIEVMGRRYDLVQFHFHRPSEERINGRQYEMDVHLVHRDPEGRLAVIAVLFDRGSPLQAVQSVWNNLPLEKGDEVVARTLLDPAELLPAARNYYTYMGSLTTPPCSEGVLWMVMKTAMPVSADQIGVFTRLYPMNARPLQAAAGRLIKESN